MAVLKVPVLLLRRAPSPKALPARPVVLLASVPSPRAVFVEPGAGPHAADAVPVCTSAKTGIRVNPTLSTRVFALGCADVILLAISIKSTIMTRVRVAIPLARAAKSVLWFAFPREAVGKAPFSRSSALNHN